MHFAWLEIKEGFHLALGVYVNNGRILEFHIVDANVLHAPQTNCIFFCTELTEIAIKSHVFNKEQQFDILMLKLSSKLASNLKKHRP